MTITKAISTVFICGLILGAVGALLGGAIGTFVPSYYRTVFRGGNEPGFDPIAIGIGQGATQGIVGGILIGMILFGMIAWRDRRPSVTGPSPEHRAAALQRWSKPWGWIFILVGIGLLLALGSCSAGVFVGALIGEQGAYDRRYEEEKRLIEETLAEDPLIRRIEIVPRSDGGARIQGSVRTKADHDRLRDLLTRALGESRARELVAGVDALK